MVLSYTLNLVRSVYSFLRNLFTASQVREVDTPEQDSKVKEWAEKLEEKEIECYMLAQEADELLQRLEDMEEQYKTLRVHSIKQEREINRLEAECARMETRVYEVHTDFMEYQRQLRRTHYLTEYIKTASLTTLNSEELRSIGVYSEFQILISIHSGVIQRRSHWIVYYWNENKIDHLTIIRMESEDHQQLQLLLADTRSLSELRSLCLMHLLHA